MPHCGSPGEGLIRLEEIVSTVYTKSGLPAETNGKLAEAGAFLPSLPGLSHQLLQALVGSLIPE